MELVLVVVVVGVDVARVDTGVHDSPLPLLPLSPLPPCCEPIVKTIIKAVQTTQANIVTILLH